MGRKNCIPHTQGQMAQRIAWAISFPLLVNVVRGTNGNDYTEYAKSCQTDSATDECATTMPAFLRQLGVFTAPWWHVETRALPLLY